MYKRISIYIGMILCISALLAFYIIELQGDSFFMVSLCLIVLVMILFFITVEKKMKLRDMLILAVMSGVSAVSRITFFFLPQCKPTAALVIITGISLGPGAGFVCGMMSAFISNFYFGQGIHTPFQMVAMGMLGFLAGIFFHNKKRNHKIVVTIFTGLSVCIIYGAIVDLSTIFLMSTKANIEMAIVIYTAAIPMNLIHGVSSAIFIYFLYESIRKRLNRVQVKYGLIGN